MRTLHLSINKTSNTQPLVGHLFTLSILYWGREVTIIIPNLVELYIMCCFSICQLIKHVFMTIKSLCFTTIDQLACLSVSPIHPPNLSQYKLLVSAARRHQWYDCWHFVTYVGNVITYIELSTASSCRWRSECLIKQSVSVS